MPRRLRFTTRIIMVSNKARQAIDDNFRRLDDEVALVSASIFSGGGIGDVGIEWGLGIPVLAACEIVPSRAKLIRRNFPHTKVFEGDVWKLAPAYAQYVRDKLNGLRPWLMTLSPPCQGMSSNGAGRISSAIRSGSRPSEDERNRLILPGIDLVEELVPDWFLLENVRRMENTIIRNEHGEPENILALLARRLHPLGYVIRSAILDFRRYGVPHHRQRLITVGCRLPSIVERVHPLDDFFCEEPTVLHPVLTHGGPNLPPPVTLREAIGQLPSLDALANPVDPNDPYHRVPCWNDRQYFWMKHTPEGQTAFDNHECPACGKTNHASDVVTCQSCSKPLPKPTVRGNEGSRLVRGFRTSYRRMKWDQPASTLTMNSGVISSDLKGHPDQNRVLSLREILLLGTLDHPRWKQRYRFEGVPYGRPVPGLDFSPRLVRQVIGESIPPLAMTRIVEHLVNLDGRF
jgi:DNA (cytosine-5)-methyltransferase 1